MSKFITVYFRLDTCSWPVNKCHVIRLCELDKGLAKTQEPFPKLLYSYLLKHSGLRIVSRTFNIHRIWFRIWVTSTDPYKIQHSQMLRQVLPVANLNLHWFFLYKVQCTCIVLIRISSEFLSTIDIWQVRYWGDHQTEIWSFKSCMNWLILPNKPEHRNCKLIQPGVLTLS